MRPERGAPDLAPESGVVGPGKAVLPVLLGAFGAFGIFAGTFAVLLADLSRALDLSPGPLGLALFAGAASSILAMAALGWTADRLGRRVFLMITGAVMGAGIVALASAGSYASLVAALVVLHAATGLYDVGINAAAVDLEKASGRRFMSVLHAAFSAGGVVGALSAGAALEAGVDYRRVYLAVLVPVGAVILAVATTRFPPPGERPESGGEGSALYRSAPLLAIALVATLALLCEGEMEHWSGVYLRRTLGLSALLGGSGVAVFYGAMAFGRLGAALVVGRFGNRRTLLGAGLLAAGGMTLALATREPLLIVVGFLVVGLALSAVVPIAFSAAGDLVPERAGVAISVVTTLGYGGFLLGPVMVGGLAEIAGLRVALAIIAASGLLIFTLSLRLKTPGRTQEDKGGQPPVPERFAPKRFENGSPDP